MLISENPSSPKAARLQETDWRLFARLIPYARKSGKLLLLSFLMLFPLAIANAVQPLLIGQAISRIRSETTWPFIAQIPLNDALNTLTLLLLATVALRLVLVAVQGYTVQRIGQQMTADIRQDLFNHVTSLGVRFFDKDRKSVV